MEPSTDIHLTWNNHQATLLTVFNTLLANEKLADCTVSAEGKSIKAHKIILAACSPYFEQVFTENPEKHPIIILPDVNFRVMKAVLGFMYHGELNVQQDDLRTVLKLSESLQLRGLSDSGYIGDEGTPRKAEGNQLLVSSENHSLQPTILSVFTLCSQESSEMEIINSFDEAPVPHSLQENSYVEMDSVKSMSRTCKKLPLNINSFGNMELASFNEGTDIGIDSGFQISEATETLPVIANVTDKSDSGVVSVHPKNNQLRESVERAKKDVPATKKSATTRKVAFNQVMSSERNIGQVAHRTKFTDHPKNSKLQESAKRAKDTKRSAKKDLLATTQKVAFRHVTCHKGNIGQVAHETKFADHCKNTQLQGSPERAKSTKRSAKKDVVATRKSTTTRKVASSQAVCSERNIGKVARETKVPYQIDTPVGITKCHTNSGSAGCNGRVNSSDVSMAVDIGVKEISAKRGRQAKRRPVQLLNKLNTKLHIKSVSLECGKSYATRGSVVRHMLHGYGKGKAPQFQCSHCKLRFFRKYCLRRHMLNRTCLKLCAS